MEIRVSYSHSAFPDDCRSETMTGVSSIRSRMETVATATLKRHSTASPWSPRPTPAPNPLFQLIERHWGVDKAREAMQLILAQRSTPRKAALAGLAAYKKDSLQSLSTSAGTSQSLSSRIGQPSVPVRQASLQRAPEPGLDPWKRHPGFVSCDRLADSMGADSQSSLSRFNAATPSSSGDRAQWSDRSPSSRSRNSGHDIRALTSEGIKNLMPKLAEFAFENREKSGRGAGTIRGTRGKKEVSTRWGWTSWFSN